MSDCCVACGEVAEGKPLYKKLGSSDCKIEVFTALHEMQLLSLPLHAKNDHYICWDCDETIAEEYANYIKVEEERRAKEEKEREENEARNQKLNKKLNQAFKKVHESRSRTQPLVPPHSRNLSKERQKEEIRYHASHCLLCSCSFEGTKARGYQRYTLKKLIDGCCTVGEALKKLGVAEEFIDGAQPRRFICSQCYNKVRRSYKSVVRGGSGKNLLPIPLHLQPAKSQEVFRRPTPEEHAAEIAKLIPPSLAHMYKVVTKEPQVESTTSKAKNSHVNNSKNKYFPSSDSSSTDSSDDDNFVDKTMNGENSDDEDYNPRKAKPSNGNHIPREKKTAARGRPRKANLKNSATKPTSRAKPIIRIMPTINQSPKTPTIRTLIPKGKEDSSASDNSAVNQSRDHSDVVLFGICNVCGLGYNSRPQTFWHLLNNSMPTIAGLTLKNALQILDTDLADVSDSIREKGYVCKPCYSRICIGFRSQILQRIAEKKGIDVNKLGLSKMKIEMMSQTDKPKGDSTSSTSKEKSNDLDLSSNCESDEGPREAKALQNPTLNNLPKKESLKKVSSGINGDIAKNLKKPKAPSNRKSVVPKPGPKSKTIKFKKIKSTLSNELKQDLRLISFINKSEHLRYKGKVVVLNSVDVNVVDIRELLQENIHRQHVRLELLKDAYLYTNYCRNLIGKDCSKCFFCHTDLSKIKVSNHWLEDPIRPPNLMVPLRWARLSLGSLSPSFKMNVAMDDGKVCSDCYSSLKKDFEKFVSNKVRSTSGTSSEPISLNSYKVSFDSSAMNIVADPLEPYSSDDEDTEKIQSISVSDEPKKEVSLEKNLSRAIVVKGQLEDEENAQKENNPQNEGNCGNKTCTDARVSNSSEKDKIENETIQGAHVENVQSKMKLGESDLQISRNSNDENHDKSKEADQESSKSESSPNQSVTQESKSENVLNTCEAPADLDAVNEDDRQQQDDTEPFKHAGHSPCIDNEVSSKANSFEEINQDPNSPTCDSKGLEDDPSDSACDATQIQRIVDQIIEELEKKDACYEQRSNTREAPTAEESSSAKDLMNTNAPSVEESSLNLMKTNEIDLHNSSEENLTSVVQFEKLPSKILDHLSIGESPKISSPPNDGLTALCTPTGAKEADSKGTSRGNILSPNMVDGPKVSQASCIKLNSQGKDPELSLSSSSTLSSDILCKDNNSSLKVSPSNSPKETESSSSSSDEQDDRALASCSSSISCSSSNSSFTDSDENDDVSENDDNPNQEAPLKQNSQNQVLPNLTKSCRKSRDSIKRKIEDTDNSPNGRNSKVHKGKNKAFSPSLKRLVSKDFARAPSPSDIPLIKRIGGQSDKPDTKKFSALKRKSESEPTTNPKKKNASYSTANCFSLLEGEESDASSEASKESIPSLFRDSTLLDDVPIDEERDEDNIAPFAPRKKARGGSMAEKNPVEGNLANPVRNDPVTNTYDMIWQTLQGICLDDLVMSDMWQPLRLCNFTMGVVLALNDYRVHLGASLEELSSWLNRLLPFELKDKGLKLSEEKISSYIFEISNDQSKLTPECLSSVIPSTLFVSNNAKKTKKNKLCFIEEFQSKECEEYFPEWTNFLRPVNVDKLYAGIPDRVPEKDFNKGFLYASWRLANLLNCDQDFLCKWFENCSPKKLPQEMYKTMAQTGPKLHAFLISHPREFKCLYLPVIKEINLASKSQETDNSEICLSPIKYLDIEGKAKETSNSTQPKAKAAVEETSKGLMSSQDKFKDKDIEIINSTESDAVNIPILSSLGSQSSSCYVTNKVPSTSLLSATYTTLSSTTNTVSTTSSSKMSIISSCELIENSSNDKTLPIISNVTGGVQEAMVQDEPIKLKTSLAHQDGQNPLHNFNKSKSNNSQQKAHNLSLHSGIDGTSTGASAHSTIGGLLGPSSSNAVSQFLSSPIAASGRLVPISMPVTVNSGEPNLKPVTKIPDKTLPASSILCPVIPSTSGMIRMVSILAPTGNLTNLPMITTPMVSVSGVTPVQSNNRVDSLPISRQEVSASSADTAGGSCNSQHSSELSNKVDNLERQLQEIREQNKKLLEINEALLNNTKSSLAASSEKVSSKNEVLKKDNSSDSLKSQSTPRSHANNVCKYSMHASSSQRAPSQGHTTANRIKPVISTPKRVNKISFDEALNYKYKK